MSQADSSVVHRAACRPRKWCERLEPRQLLSVSASPAADLPVDPGASSDLLIPQVALPTVPWDDPTLPVPAPNDLAAHDGFVQQAKQGHIGLLFLGDSITYEWDGKAKSLYHQLYDKYDPAVFAVKGDKTQNLLWRIDKGELDGISPKVVVLMIGANNVGLYGGETEAGVVQGVAKVVDTIREKLPTTKILLMGILPMGEFADNPARQRIRRINTALAALDDGGKTLRILDIGSHFLDINDDLPPSLVPDGVHPTANGYQIWANAMQPALDALWNG
jgi:lysophospholipase L1-like esterase